ncbi:Spore coat protein E [compost metagenome]
MSADVIQEPNCIEANVSSDGSSVVVRVEREYSVELVAETKVCVAVLPGGCGDLDGKELEFGLGDDNDYEDLDPELLDDEL